MAELPRKCRPTQYIKYENSGYSLNFNGSQLESLHGLKLESDDYSHISADKAPDTIELRFNATKPQSSFNS